MVKFDREVVALERAIRKNDLVEARRIIEFNLAKFTDGAIRKLLSLDALSLINYIVSFNTEENKVTFSRKTQLIVQHINKLAYEGNFSNFKRFYLLNKELFSDPKVYSILNTDAKILIPAPEKVTQLT